jgi:hypothetical protein
MVKRYIALEGSSHPHAPRFTKAQRLLAERSPLTKIDVRELKNAGRWPPGEPT